jgi:hypothetical protein
MVSEMAPRPKRLQHQPELVVLREKCNDQIPQQARRWAQKAHPRIVLDTMADATHWIVSGLAVTDGQRKRGRCQGAIAVVGGWYAFLVNHGLPQIALYPAGIQFSDETIAPQSQQQNHAPNYARSCACSVLCRYRDCQSGHIATHPDAMLPEMRINLRGCLRQPGPGWPASIGPVMSKRSASGPGPFLSRLERRDRNRSS